MNCIFCKIIKKEIPAQPVFENDHVLAIHDRSPKAPVHLLILSKKHIATLNDLAPEDLSLMSHMTEAAVRLAKEFKIADSGYRTMMNCNKDGGQTVYHIHMHLLGGKSLQHLDF